MSDYLETKRIKIMKQFIKETDNEKHKEIFRKKLEKYKRELGVK